MVDSALPRGPRGHVNVWSPKKVDARLVVLLSDDRDIVAKQVHWLGKELGSAPCPGEGRCRFHEVDLNDKWYAPVVVSRFVFLHCPESRPHGFVDNVKASCWEFRVLEITLGNASIVDEAQPGNVYHVSRPLLEGSVNKVFFKRQLWSLPREVNQCSFNVEPHLAHMWAKAMAKPTRAARSKLQVWRDALPEASDG